MSAGSDRDALEAAPSALLLPVALGPVPTASCSGAFIKDGSADVAIVYGDTITVQPGSAELTADPIVQQPLGSPAYAICTLRCPEDATGADAIVAALECGVLAVLRFSARAQRLVVVQRLHLPTAPPPPGLGGRHLAASPCGSAVLACARLHALAVFWRSADAPEQIWEEDPLAHARGLHATPVGAHQYLDPCPSSHIPPPAEPPRCKGSRHAPRAAAHVAAVVAAAADVVDAEPGERRNMHLDEMWDRAMGASGRSPSARGDEHRSGCGDEHRSGCGDEHRSAHTCAVDLSGDTAVVAAACLPCGSAGDCRVALLLRRRWRLHAAAAGRAALRERLRAPARAAVAAAPAAHSAPTGDVPPHADAETQRSGRADGGLVARLRRSRRVLPTASDTPAGAAAAAAAAGTGDDWFAALLCVGRHACGGGALARVVPLDEEFASITAAMGEPQGVMAVPGTRSAVAVLFASHIALRDFSAPSWRVGCGGAITALLPTSDVGRRLAGHVGVSSDGDLAGLSQLGPNIRSHRLPDAAISESTSPPSHTAAAAPQCHASAGERLLAAWLPALTPHVDAAAPPAAGVKRRFDAAMHGDAAAAPQVAQLLLLGATSGHLVRLFVSLFLPPEPAPPDPAASAAAAGTPVPTILGLPVPSGLRRGAGRPAQEQPRPITAAPGPWTRSRSRSAPVLSAAHASATAPRFALQAAALCCATASGDALPLPGEAVYMHAGGTGGGVLVRCRSGHTIALTPAPPTACAPEATCRHPAGARQSLRLQRQHQHRSAADLNVPGAARRPAPPSRWLKAPPRLEPAVDNSGVPAAASLAAVPGGHCAAALVLSTAAGGVHVLRRSAALSLVATAPPQPIVHSLLPCVRGRVLAVSARSTEVLQLRGARDGSGAAVARLRRARGHVLPGLCFAAGTIAAGVDVVVCEDRAVSFQLSSALHDCSSSSSSGSSSRGMDEGVPAAQNADSSTIGGAEWRPEADAAVVAAAVTRGVAVVATGGAAHKIHALCLRGGSLACVASWSSPEVRGGGVAVGATENGVLVATCTGRANEPPTLWHLEPRADRESWKLSPMPWGRCQGSRAGPCNQLRLGDGCFGMESMAVTYVPPTPNSDAAAGEAVVAVVAAGTRDGRVVLWSARAARRTRHSDTWHLESALSCAPEGALALGTRPVHVAEVECVQLEGGGWEWRLVATGGAGAAAVAVVVAADRAGVRVRRCPLATHETGSAEVARSMDAVAVLGRASGVACGSRTEAAPLVLAVATGAATGTSRVAAYALEWPFREGGAARLSAAAVPAAAPAAPARPAAALFARLATHGGEWVLSLRPHPCGLSALLPSSAAARFAADVPSTAASRAASSGAQCVTCGSDGEPSVCSATRPPRRGNQLESGGLDSPAPLTRPPPAPAEQTPAVCVRAAAVTGGGAVAAAAPEAAASHTLWRVEPGEELSAVATWAPCAASQRVAERWTNEPAAGLWAAACAGRLATAFVAVAINLPGIRSASGESAARRELPCISRVEILGVEMRECGGGAGLAPFRAHTVARCAFNPARVGALAACRRYLFVAAGASVCAVASTGVACSAPAAAAFGAAGPCGMGLVVDWETRMPTRAVALSVDEERGLLLAADAAHSVCVFKIAPPPSRNRPFGASCKPLKLLHCDPLARAPPLLLAPPATAPPPPPPPTWLPLPRDAALDAVGPDARSFDAFLADPLAARLSLQHQAWLHGFFGARASAPPAAPPCAHAAARAILCPHRIALAALRQASVVVVQHSAATACSHAAARAHRRSREAHRRVLAAATVAALRAAAADAELMAPRTCGGGAVVPPADSVRLRLHVRAVWGVACMFTNALHHAAAAALAPAIAGVGGAPAGAEILGADRVPASSARDWQSDLSVFLCGCLDRLRRAAGAPDESMVMSPWFSFADPSGRQEGGAAPLIDTWGAAAPAEAAAAARAAATALAATCGIEHGGAHAVVSSPRDEALGPRRLRDVVGAAAAAARKTGRASDSSGKLSDTSGNLSDSSAGGGDDAGAALVALPRRVAAPAWLEWPGATAFGTPVLSGLTRPTLPRTQPAPPPPPAPAEGVRAACRKACALAAATSYLPPLLHLRVAAATERFEQITADEAAAQRGPPQPDAHAMQQRVEDHALACVVRAFMTDTRPAPRCGSDPPPPPPPPASAALPRSFFAGGAALRHARALFEGLPGGAPPELRLWRTLVAAGLAHSSAHCAKVPVDTTGEASRASEPPPRSSDRTPSALQSLMAGAAAEGAAAAAAPPASPRLLSAAVHTDGSLVTLHTPRDAAVGIPVAVRVRLPAPPVAAAALPLRPACDGAAAAAAPAMPPVVTADACGTLTASLALATAVTPHNASLLRRLSAALAAHPATALAAAADAAARAELLAKRSEVLRQCEGRDVAAGALHGSALLQFLALPRWLQVEVAESMQAVSCTGGTQSGRGAVAGGAPSSAHVAEVASALLEMEHAW